MLYLVAPGLSCIMRDLIVAPGLSSCDWHTLESMGFSHCSAWAYLLCGLWGLSFLTRDGICVPCIARQNLNYWTTREVPGEILFAAIGR